MRKCCVQQCPNSRIKTIKVPLFSFPRDAKLRKKWIQALKIEESLNLDYARVCMHHFAEDDVFRFSSKTKLKANRVPHLNLLSTSSVNAAEDLVIVPDLPSGKEPLNASSQLSPKSQQSQSNDTEALSNQKSQQSNRKKFMMPPTYLFKPPFAIERFWKNDRKIFYYTGIQTHKILIILYDFVFKSEKGPGGTVHQTDSKTSAIRSHKLSPLNELFLTLIKLRKAIDYHMLGDMFWISEASACRIFNAWINLLYTKLGNINIFPHRDVLFANAPKDFLKKYPNVIGSIDCAEFMIETPSSLVQQSQCFLNYEYKRTNTLKGLLMINATGAIIFVSALHTSSISDKQIVNDSNFLKLLRKKISIKELEVGDIILADKGFNINELLQDIGIELNIPTFRMSGMQFTPDELQYIRTIAHQRVHVERAIRRLKTFKILGDKIPISLLGIVNEIFTVCALLTNFRFPLRT